MNSQDGLLSRWAQRRQRVAEEADQDNQLQANESLELRPQTDVAEQTQLDIASTDVSPEEEPLPDPTTIEVGGSFARFMAKNVDPTTKAAALRALWKQPQYGHIDGLLEYALDYTNQPVLSADVSAELANKVFRYVVEKTNNAEDELLADAQTDVDKKDDTTGADSRVAETCVEEPDSVLAVTRQSECLSTMDQVQDDDLLEHAFASDEAKG